MVPALQQDIESFQELHRRRCLAVAGVEQSHAPSLLKSCPFFIRMLQKNDGIKNPALFHIFLVLCREDHVDPEWQHQFCHCRVKPLLYFSFGAETFF